jgi:hypothetical protein
VTDEGFASTSSRGRRLVGWVDGHRGDLVWYGLIAILYVASAWVLSHGMTFSVDRAMRLAVGLTQGRLDLDPDQRPNDIVTIDGRLYQTLSPLPIVAYLPFVPFPEAWGPARTLLPTLTGLAAAWLCLPLARAYGPGGAVPYWLATCGAIGTVLFTLSIQSNYYYLAQVQAALFTILALLEWRGRRRAWIIGLCLGLAGLARPTVLLAALPLGAALWWTARDRWSAALSFGAPIALTLVVAGAYNAVRFGSPLESGYGISYVTGPLAERRALGLFSLAHLPENLGILLARGFDIRREFPFLVPDRGGHSILLTTPAVLIAVRAGFRRFEAVVLWLATAFVAVPVLLYYGGGGATTFGYRYALDALPFVFALMAMGARSQFGNLERALILLSVVLAGYGLIWLLSS